jgi:hypothetical protein
MAPEDRRAPETARQARCLLVLRCADGSVTSVGPLARDRAEAMVLAYDGMYPNQTCWVEPLRREVEDLHVGRLRRVGRGSLAKASDRGH